MYFIWPYIQKVISMLGNLVQNTGYIGTLIYGIIERALIPFGLHHVFYMPFWQTNVGGSMEIAGQTINGAQNIFFAQLADPNTTKFSVDATRFMAGKFPFMSSVCRVRHLQCTDVPETKRKKLSEDFCFRRH